MRRSRRAGLVALILVLGISGCSASDSGSLGRFEACPDGLTVADNATGLLWEKKTGVLGNPRNNPDATGPDRPCKGIDDLLQPNGLPKKLSCGDDVGSGAHDVNNRYTWSNGPDPDFPFESGWAWKNFLARLNTCSPGYFPDGIPPFRCWQTYPDPPPPSADPPLVPAPPFAGYDDWRLPTRDVWTMILVGPGAGSGQPQVCLGKPCLDPEFAAIAGPNDVDNLEGYWSGSEFNDQFPELAWYADLAVGAVQTAPKDGAGKYVRAVRNGSCGE